MTPIELYTWRYPQLALAIEEGMSKTEAYGNIVRRGILPEHPAFSGKETGEEKLLLMDTPTGAIEVLYLPEREMFEYFVRALAHRCEPAAIPPSMGAVMISGLNNWRKIESHKKEYLAQGKTDWQAEFKRFTAKKENYKDTVLLVSKGYYSAVTPKEAGFTPEEWMEKSRTIRIYHELAHAVSRKLYPDDVQTVRDEVVADSIGLLAAFGTYDGMLAKMLLGIREGAYHAGGRLENYVESYELERMVRRAEIWIETLQVFYENSERKKPLEYLLEDSFLKKLTII